MFDEAGGGGTGRRHRTRTHPLDAIMEGQHTTPPRLSSGSLEEVRYRARLRQLESEQNLFAAVLAGGIAAVIGAITWAMITLATSYRIGWLAVGVGFLVGYAVRLIGKGITPLYGVVAAVLALLGCLGGNVLTTCIILSREEALPLSEVLLNLDASAITDVLLATWQPIDLLFYGLAVYMAYQYGYDRPSVDGPGQGPSVAAP